MIKRIVTGMLVPLLLGVQGCTSMFFYPMPQHVMTPDRLGIAYEDIGLASVDGTRLHGWWLHARQPDVEQASGRTVAQAGQPRAIILFFHGNAQNISTHFAHVHWLVDYGFDVVMVDYRGYGKSAGKAGLDGSLQDIQATLRYVYESRQNDLPMLVIGQSIGGSMAVAALAQSELKDQLSGIVLIGSFSDYRKITQHALSGFWLTWPLQWPLSFTVDNSYSPQRYIADLAPVPVLIMHGGQDPVVPVAHARQLYEHASEPRYLEIIDGDHNHILSNRHNRERLLEYLNRFVRQQ